MRTKPGRRLLTRGGASGAARAERAALHLRREPRDVLARQRARARAHGRRAGRRGDRRGPLLRCAPRGRPKLKTVLASAKGVHFLASAKGVPCEGGACVSLCAPPAATSAACPRANAVVPPNVLLFRKFLYVFWLTDSPPRHRILHDPAVGARRCRARARVRDQPELGRGAAAEPGAEQGARAWVPFSRNLAVPAGRAASPPLVLTGRDAPRRWPRAARCISATTARPPRPVPRARAQNRAQSRVSIFRSKRLDSPRV